MVLIKTLVLKMLAAQDTVLSGSGKICPFLLYKLCPLTRNRWVNWPSVHRNTFSCFVGAKSSHTSSTHCKFHQTARDKAKQDYSSLVLCSRASSRLLYPTVRHIRLDLASIPGLVVFYF